MKRKRQAAPKGQPASPGSADPNVLLLERPKPGETKGGVLAGMLVAGLLSNAVAAREWSQVPFNRDADLTATLANVVRAAERVNRGDLTSAEAVLTAQAVTLNAVFTNLAYRADKTDRMDHLDRYLRLASMLSLNAGRRARRWPCSRTPRTAEGKARSSRNACLELAEAKATEWPRKRLPSRPPGQRQPERTMLMSLRMTIRQTIEARRR